MTIQSVTNNQSRNVSQQLSSASQTTTTSTSTYSAESNSNNATVLSQTEKSIKQQISQLQGKGSSSKEVQQLNQILNDVQKKLQNLSAAGNSPKAAAESASSSSMLLHNEFDTKA